MSKKTIMLACAAGMSTSLMVRKMEEAAEEMGLEYSIFAVPATAARDVLDERDVDLILLGPQLSYMIDDFERLTKDKPVPIGVINMLDYGTMNGKKTILFANGLLDK